MSTTPTCSTCIFYHDTFRCRRYPPAVVNELGHGLQPWVTAGDWCGEHRPAEVAPAAPKPPRKPRA